MELYTKELRTAYSTLIESVDNFNSSLLNSIEESRTLVSSYKEMYDSISEQTKAIGNQVEVLKAKLEEVTAEVELK